MSKIKFRDKGLSATVAQADRLMKQLPKYAVREDDDHVEVPWNEFVYGSMRGQYRTIGRHLDLLGVVNLHTGNGHFRRLLEYARDTFQSVRVLLPHERLRSHLIGHGFKDHGEHVVWRRGGNGL